MNTHLKWTDVVFASLIILSLPFLYTQQLHYVAGFAPVIINNYTEVIWGTTITEYPPPYGPYPETVFNWGVPLFQVCVIGLWILTRRKLQ